VSVSEPLFPRLARPDGGEAIRIGDEALTYDRLARGAAAVAKRVRGARRVAVWAQPTLELCIGVVGALAAGAAVVPLNAGSGSRELDHILTDSAPELLLTAPGGTTPAAKIPTIDVNREQDGGPLPDELADDGIAFVMYTSGTTGPPKGVQIPRRAIASNLDALAEIWSWTADDRLTHSLPVFHVHGLILGILGPLRVGGQVEHAGRFSAAALASSLRRGATMMFGVPTMYHRIATEATVDASLAEAFAGARLLVSGSAPLAVSDHERIRELTGQSVLERYGMTETLMNAGVRTGEEIVPGRVGRPLPNVELKLIDEAGGTLDARDDETIGEIAVRGPNLFAGYLNRPVDTAAALKDGWFITGDLATRNQAGSLRIVGRKSTDLIKSGGYRIGAGEIEAALLQHPAVAEAAVAGRPDPDLGERIAAWVVTEPGSAVSADELGAHVEQQLSRHKRPREVHLVQSLPRNEMGKVLKRVLADGDD
jgi:malonyl-CoA/methylmalonyl-CoA synthetase